MKTISMFTTAVFAALFYVAHADTVTNIYAVTAASGSDYKTPSILDNMMVVCTDTAGSVPVQMSFADLAAGGFGENSIFRKLGAGWMQSSVKMATFRGEIRIEEGGFIVTTNLMTGAQDYDTAPVVRVSPGATFMLNADNSTCPANTLKLCNEFHLAGDGFDGMGVICNASENSQYNTPFAGPWYLEDDVKIYHTSWARWDMGDLTHAGHAFIDMKGHNLRYVFNTEAVLPAWYISVGCRMLNPGNFYVDGQRLCFQGIGDFEGNSSNCLVFTNGARVGMYDVNAKIPWSVKFYGGGYFACNEYPSGLEYTNRNSFAGPIEIHDGALRLSRKNSRNHLS